MEWDLETEEQRAAWTARSSTVTGIEFMIRNAQREIALLDKMDANYGNLGRASRQADREERNREIARYRRALEMKADAA